jgi:hypothetical protein
VSVDLALGAEKVHARRTTAVMPDLKKLTVNLSPALVEVLKELAADDETTMTDALKKAIEQRKYLLDKVRDGNEIGIIPDDPNAPVKLVDIEGPAAKRRSGPAKDPDRGRDVHGSQPASA